MRREPPTRGLSVADDGATSKGVLPRAWTIPDAPLKREEPLFRSQAGQAEPIARISGQPEQQPPGSE
jgi:hypothetical protein